MQLIYAVVKRLSVLTPDIELPQISDIDAYHIGKEEMLCLNQWVNDYLKKNLLEIVEQTFHTSIPAEEVSVDFEDIDVSYDMYFLKDRTTDYLFQVSCWVSNC